MSWILTQQLARQAIELVLPVLALMTEQGIVKRRDMHIVVLDPTHTGRFEDSAILCEHQVGDVRKWEHSYDAIALKKAKMSFEHRLPSQVIVEQVPYLLEGGDTKYFGNACQDGLIVAASGVEPWFDQMVSEMIVAVIRGLCIDEMRKEIAGAAGDTLNGTEL